MFPQSLLILVLLLFDFFIIVDVIVFVLYLFSIIAMGFQVVFCLFKKEDVKVYNEKLHIMFPAEA